MKTLAALLAIVSMSGCVVHFPHGREHADGHKRGTPVVVVCIFASCKVTPPPPEAESL